MTSGTIVQMKNGFYGVRGAADDLAAAYEAGTPVTPTNSPYRQDRLYLGRTRETYSDYGRSLESLGLAYTKDSGEAVYHLDISRLGEAPAFRAALEEVEDQAEEAQSAMARRDDEYLNPPYT